MTVISSTRIVDPAVYRRMGPRAAVLARRANVADCWSAQATLRKLLSPGFADDAPPIYPIGGNASAAEIALDVSRRSIADASLDADDIDGVIYCHTVLDARLSDSTAGRLQHAVLLEQLGLVVAPFDAGRLLAARAHHPFEAAARRAGRHEVGDAVEVGARAALEHVDAVRQLEARGRGRILGHRVGRVLRRREELDEARVGHADLVLVLLEALELVEEVHRVRALVDEREVRAVEQVLEEVRPAAARVHRALLPRMALDAAQARGRRGRGVVADPDPDVVVLLDAVEAAHLERRGDRGALAQRRHVHAAAGAVEAPAVVRAGERAVAHRAERELRAAMAAAILERARDALAVAVDDQPAIEHRRRARARAELAGGAGDVPVVGQRRLQEEDGLRLLSGHVFFAQEGHRAISVDLQWMPSAAPKRDRETAV